jgi:hypothetical protein
MPGELLPRGNVREFESWLVREVVHKHLHHTRLEKEGSKLPWGEMCAHAELCTAVNILARYTDRRPDDLHKVADSFRELRRVIREGRSWAKQNEAQVKRALAAEDE